MLKEYFALDISDSGDILTLPHLLKEYTPDVNKLPTFLMRLGPQVSSPYLVYYYSSYMTGELEVGDGVLRILHA